MIGFGEKNEELGEYIFMISLEEDPSGLSIVIAPGVSAEKMPVGAQESRIEELLVKCDRIVPDKTRLYKIFFSRCLFHIGRDESFVAEDPLEEAIGTHLVICDKSILLNQFHTLMDSFLIDHMNKGRPLQHYGIYCQDNIIDVITIKKPVISKLFS